MTQDEVKFGEKVWVYCNQHLRPHLTGWCTVDVGNKTKLDAKAEEEAYAECRAKGFKIYGEKQ